MAHRADPRPACGGFSLLEMLVALAVLSLALLALLKLSGETTRAALLAEERVLAEVVADNHAVDAMLVPGDELARGAGLVRNGERDWRWQVAPLHAGDGLVQVVVQVSDPASGQLVAERRLLRALP
ncbi:MAG: type II secretion system protein GspI [Lysobacteraceae bacterium]|nr:MAG: type II secretion system protein GspI [Xanthomonadaceae bacterium]